MGTKETVVPCKLYHMTHTCSVFRATHNSESRTKIQFKIFLFFYILPHTWCVKDPEIQLVPQLSPEPLDPEPSEAPENSQDLLIENETVVKSISPAFTHQGHFKTCMSSKQKEFRVSCVSFQLSWSRWDQTNNPSTGHASVPAR